MVSPNIFIKCQKKLSNITYKVYIYDLITDIKNVKNMDNGCSILHIWASYNESRLKKTLDLLNIGADVNSRDNYGRTPLHNLVMLKSNDRIFSPITKMLDLLVKYGADTETVDNYGRKPAYQLNYLKWKRKNVTLRGLKEEGIEENGVYGSYGKGLYTAYLSNKHLAAQYGKVYFVVNARPKHPKLLNNLNDAEIFIQQIVYKNYKNRGEFEKITTIEDEVMKLGYDGIDIKGREVVNYKAKDVIYFKDERQLELYFDSVIRLNYKRWFE